MHGFTSHKPPDTPVDWRKLGDFGMLILYGRVLRNFIISSITCASFER
jgi:hypothetical protein